MTTAAHALVPSTYLERYLPMASREATAAFDAAIDRVIAMHWPRRPTIEAERASLRLTPNGRAQDRGPHFPLRALFAEVVVGRRRHSVELELLRWSDTACSLGLRRISGRIPSPLDLRWVAYERAGDSLLAEVAALTLARAGSDGRQESPAA